MTEAISNLKKLQLGLNNPVANGAGQLSGNYENNNNTLGVPETWVYGWLQPGNIGQWECSIPCCE